MSRLSTDGDLSNLADAMLILAVGIMLALVIH